jgi:hypothetical protein
VSAGFVDATLVYATIDARCAGLGIGGLWPNDHTDMEKRG